MDMIETTAEGFEAMCVALDQQCVAYRLRRVGPGTWNLYATDGQRLIGVIQLPTGAPGRSVGIEHVTETRFVALSPVQKEGS